MARQTCTLALLLCLLALGRMAEGRSRRGDNGQRDENQDNQRSREEALIQAQVDAQNRHNQKALEQLGIADEWQQESGRSRGGKDDSEDSGKRSRGGKRGRRDDSDNEEQQDGGRGDRNQDEDNSDWSSGLSRKEKRRARKEAREAGMDVAEYMSQHGSGRKRGRGSRRSGSNWGADNPEVERRGRGRGGRGRGGVPATYHYYSPAYETSQLYCADAFRDTPGRQLLRRPWMAYCAGDGMSVGKCGSCARVTNLATGDSTVMMIVDMCGTGGVDMDPVGFNAIDGDGAGMRDGHMDVSVELCGC